MNSKTPVSLLQEELMKQYKPLPQYTIKQLSDGVTPEFECTVTVGVLTCTSRSYSKQQAKHKSAEQMLKIYSSLYSITNSPVHENFSNITSSVHTHKNYIGELNELSSKRGWTYPVYTYIRCLENSDFMMKCEFAGLETYGTAPNKKDAKQRAAAEMLSILEERKLNNIPPKEVNRIPSRVNVNISDDIDELTEIYKKLSFKMKQRMETKPKLSSAEIGFIDESGLTVRNFKDVLQALGVNYTIKTLQVKPLVLMLHITDTNQVILETGEVYEDTLSKLLQKSITYYNFKIHVENKKAFRK